MFATTKIALSAAILINTALAASAATKHRATDDNQSAAHNVIPGYDKNGQTVGVPDPEASTDSSADFLPANRLVQRDIKAAYDKRGDTSLRAAVHGS